MAQIARDNAATLPPPPLVPWSPTQPQLPPGFNPYAAPADQRGASTDPNATIHDAISSVPILGGLAQLGQTQFNQGPLGGMLLGRDQRYAGVQPGSPEQKQLNTDRLTQLAGGVIGGGDTQAAGEAGGALSQIVGGLTNRIGGKGSVAGDIAAEGAGPLQTAAQKAAVTSDRFTTRPVPGGKGGMFEVVDNTTGTPLSLSFDSQAKADALASKRNGATTPEQVQAVFGDPNAGRVTASLGSVPSDLKQVVRQAIRGDGIESIDAATQTRLNAALQNALRANGAPVTAQAVQSLSDQLISEAGKVNKISRANGRAATPREVVADANTATVRQAVKEAVPTPDQIAREQAIRDGAATPSDTVPVADTAPNSPPPPGGPKITTPGGGETNIPTAPIHEPVVNVILRNALGLTRANLVTGHLALLRQMLPGLTYAGSKGRVDIVAHALGAMARGITSDAAGVSERIAGMKQTLADLGLDKSVFLNHPNAHVSQSEEAMLVGGLPRRPGVTAAVGAVSGFAGADPNSTLDQRLERAAKGAAVGAAVGLSAGRLNQAYGMGVNALRTDLAVSLANEYKKIGAVDGTTGKLTGAAADKVGHFVNILTGRGDLIEKLAGKAGPDAKEAAKALQDAASGIFFGPRLMTSTWQQAADTIGSLHGIVPDTVHAIISGQPLDPARLATIRATASFVAFGSGLMLLAHSQGLPVGIDSNKSDWGLITLPDGAKIDMWGAYRTFARDVAQELNYAQQLATGTVPKGPFAKTGITIAGDYFRSHLNPPAGVGVDYASGQTALGQPPSLDPINPVKNPPFGVATGEYAFGAGNAHQPAGPGGLLGAGETALTALGAGVQPPTLLPKRDALGRIDDGALPASPITDAWAKVQAAVPSLGALQAPDRNIGAGPSKIVLSDGETDQLRVLTGNARTTLIGQVVASPAFQSASPEKQQKLLSGAKLEADRQGQVAFALAQAKTAPDDASRVRAATIGIKATQTTGATMDFISKLDQSGALNSTVHAAIDDMRTQSNPLNAKYELSVSDYLKGAGLVAHYIATPAFTVGTPQDWADVAKQGAALKATYQSLLREAAVKSTATKKVSVDQLPDYAHYIKDYTTARTASGRAISAFVTKAGTVNPALVSPQRLAIEKDPLFAHFIAVAQQRDPFSIKSTATVAPTPVQFASIPEGSTPIRGPSPQQPPPQPAFIPTSRLDISQVEDRRTPAAPVAPFVRERNPTTPAPYPGPPPWIP